MDVDVRRLQQLTRKAQERQRAEREEQMAQERHEAELKRLQEEQKAQMVISQIAHRAETEAIAGHNHAVLMSVGFADYDRPRQNRTWNYCNPIWLKGACRLVFEHCEKIRLEPTLEYWHDGVGVKSGFNIVIHW